MGKEELLSKDTPRVGQHTVDYTVEATKTGLLAIRGLPADSDKGDSRNTASVVVSVSSNGGKSFEPYLAFTWAGNSKLDKQGKSVPPTALVDVSELVGKTLRVVLTVPRSMGMGLEIETQ